MKKVLTFVLIISMLMGNVVPAYATDTTIISNPEGDGIVMSDEGEDATSLTIDDEDGEDNGDDITGSEGESEDGDDTTGSNTEGEDGSADNGDDTTESEGESEDGGDDTTGSNTEGEGGSTDNGDDTTGSEGESEDGGDDTTGSNTEGEDGNTDNGDDTTGSEGESEDGGDNTTGSNTESEGGSMDSGDDTTGAEDGSEDEGDDTTGTDEGTLGEDDENKDDELIDEELTDEELTDEELLEEEEKEEEDDVAMASPDFKMEPLPTYIAANKGGEPVQEKYATVGAAIQELASDGKDVTIILPQEGLEGYGAEYYVSGNDLVANTSATVNIELNGNTLLAVQDESDNTVIESNVGLFGGEIHLQESGLTFKILEKNNGGDVMVSNLQFTGSDNSGKLIVGGNTTDNTQALIAAGTVFDNVTLGGIGEIAVYDRFDIDTAINVNTLTIDLDSYDINETDTVSEFAYLSNIEVTDLDIKGNISWLRNGATAVTVTGTTEMETEGPYEEIVLRGTCQFNKLTVEGEAPLNLVQFFEWYTDGNQNLVPSITTNLQFKTSVTTNGYPIKMIYRGQKPAGESYQMIEEFPADSVIATISGEVSQGDISAELFQAEGVNIVREGNQLLAEEKQELFRVMNAVTMGEIGIYPDFATMIADMQKNPGIMYQVQLLKDVPLSDGEHWDFSNEGTQLNVNLQLADNKSGEIIPHTLSVAEGATAAITVDEINGTGIGCIKIGNNGELRLKGDYNGKDIMLSVYGINVQAEGSNGKLVLGNPEVEGRKYVSFNSVNFSNCGNLDVELYGNVNWNAKTRANNFGFNLVGKEIYTTPESCAATLRSLKVENISPDGAFLGGQITVNNLSVDGNLNCDTMTAGTTTLAAGSFLCTSDVMTLNNITVAAKEGKEEVILATEDIYQAGEKKHSGSIYLTGYLKYAQGAEDTCISFDKGAVNVVKAKNPMGYSITSPYTSGSQINNEDVLATLDTKGNNGNAIGQLLSNQAYKVYRAGFVSVVEEIIKDEATTYVVKAVDSTKGIFVYDQVTGQAESFTNLKSARDHIYEKFHNQEAPTSEIEINVNQNITAFNANDLDYSDLKVSSIKLNLNGYEVTLISGGIVSVDEIDGYNDNKVQGKLILSTVNTMKPRNGELYLNGAVLKPAKANTTTLTLGDAERVGESSIIIEEPGSSVNLKSLYTFGKIDWRGDKSKTITVAADFVVKNIQDADSEKCINLEKCAEFAYKVTTKNLDLTEGDLLAADLTVSNQLNTKTGSRLQMEPAGKLTLKNVYVKTSLGEEVQETDNSSFYIELDRKMTLKEGDNGENPTFEGAAEVLGKATVTISGAVTNDAQVRFPISLKKLNQWQYTDGQGEKADSSKVVNFTVTDTYRETLATINTATANKFMIYTSPYNTEACTRKEGTTLQAASRVLKVCLEGTNISNSYASLEDAVANISKEFVDGSGKTMNGTYRFIFLKDTSITKALTLPTCVQSVIFTTDGSEESGYSVRNLDLKTYGLTVGGNILMQGGLEINGASTAKLTAKKDVSIEIQKLLPVDEVTVKEYHPWGEINVDISKGKLTVNAGNVASAFGGITTVKSLDIKGNGSVSMNKVIMKTGRIELQNSVVEIIDLTMEKSKLYVGQSTLADILNLTVKSAYGQESLGDYTIEVMGCLNTSVMTIPAGTFRAGSYASVTIKTVSKIKDLILEEGAAFLCDEMTQVSGAKSYLNNKSILYINKKGTLDTLVIGGKEGKEGVVYLGTGCQRVDDETKRAKDGTLGEITVNKVPTRNTENLHVEFFATNKYYGMFDGEIQAGDYRVIIGATRNNYERLIANELAALENMNIFRVASAVKNFPAEFVEVAQPVEALNVYQSGSAIVAIGKYITVSDSPADGNGFKELKRFTSWKDTMDYLTAHGNTLTTYHIEINKDIVSVGGKMTLPKNVGMLIIEGGLDDKPTYLDFTGDVSLNSDTEFKNVTFTKDGDSDTGAHGIAASGRKLVLENVESTLKSLTGSKTGEVSLIDSAVIVANKVQNIGTVKLTGSVLEVLGNKAFTVGQVYLSEYEKSVQNKIKSRLWVDGKATITDLTVEGQGNQIASRDLVINGNVLSSDYTDVKAVPVKQEQVVTHYVFDNLASDYTVKKNFILITKINSFGQKVVPKKGENVSMVTAAKVPASWFVVDRTDAATNETILEGGKLTAIDLTHKEGNKIVSGAEIAGKVVLDKKSGADSYVTLDTFDTLQEALNEIAAIGNAQAEYRISLRGDDSVATADYKFTEKKVGKIVIRAAETLADQYDDGDGKAELTYKKDLDLKTNVTFENIILNPISDGALKINKYTVELNNSFFAEGKKISVTDTGAVAELIINNVVIDQEEYKKVSFASVKQSGTLSVTDTKLDVSGDIKTGVLEMSDATVTAEGKADLGKLTAQEGDVLFAGYGVINIKDVYLGTDGTVETVAVPTWSENKITALKSQLTITGNLSTKTGNENLEFVLTSKYADGTVITSVEEQNDVTKTATEVLVENCTPSLLENGLIIGKAANISTSDVTVVTNGYSTKVVKKNGELFCKDTETYVTLQYEAGKDSNGTPIIVESSFETFADVVKEIDTLKVKRDYVVIFDGNGSVDGNQQPQELPIPQEAVMSLSMPKAANARSLTLGGVVYYTGNVTFTSDVVLDNMKFVQVVSTETGYLPAEKMLVEGNPYPVPVKVGTGGFKLSLAEDTLSEFNTPIELSGSKKGTLDLSGSGRLLAGANWSGYSGDKSDKTVIQGKITGFALMKVGTRSVQILGYPTHGEDTVNYNYTMLESTQLNIDGNVEVLVGHISKGRASQTENKDNATIKELTIAGGKLKVLGEGTFTNVTLYDSNNGENPKLEVLGQKFDITGNLTNTSSNAEITASYGSDYASVLNVKGEVILEDKKAKRITICVADGAGNPIQLDNIINGELRYGTRLLTAAKADAKDFKPASDCVEDGLNEYTHNSKQGYILKKNGNFIEVVLRGDEACKAALYSIDGNSETLINYYPSVNDAVKDIDVLKDKTKEYKVLLFKDLGTEEVYEELKMPKEAKKVVFEAYAEQGEVRKIYFGKDITLGCNTEFKSLAMFSVQKDGKTTASVKANANQLTLNDCRVNVKDITSTGVLNVNNGTVVTVEGKATLQDVELFGNAETYNKICYSTANAKNITIKGKIHQNGNAEPLYLDVAGKVALPKEENYKLTATKVANIEKASFDSFEIWADADETSQNPETPNPDNPLTVAWDSKGIYRIKTDYKNDVEVTDNLGNRVVCLDLTEAAEYVNNTGDPINKTYRITLSENVDDTNVTDTKVHSKVTLPAKDKAAGVVLDGTGHKLWFTESIVTNGAVTIENIILHNEEKDFDISNNKNSKGANPAELILDRVQLESGKLSKKIANIKGTAKATNLIIQGTKENLCDLTVTGSITNIVDFKLKDAKVESKNPTAKSNVTKLIVESRGIWETYGATTIGEIELQTLSTGTEGINTYIATSRANATAKPKLTINGTVTGGAVPVKLFDMEGGYLEEGKTPSKYQGQQLLTAKTEAAGKFIAVDFVKINNNKNGYEFKSEDIQAYKDASNLVMNGDITQMDVLLTTSQTKTYVQTYADAIKIINNIGNKNAEYTITLLNPGNDMKAVMTNATNGVSSYGKFNLPNANKAAALTIRGEGGKKVELCYTGNIAPKCNLNFENVHLSEGTVKTVTIDGVKEQIFTNSGVITLNLGNVVMTLGEGVTGGHRTQDERNGLTPEYYDNNTVALKSISGSKGTLVLTNGQKVYVQGATTIPNLHLDGETEHRYAIYTCGKTAITDITGKGKLELGTYYSANLWPKAKTQLQLKGVVDANVFIEIAPYIMLDKTTKEYGPMTEPQIDELMFLGNGKPAAYQQIAVAPKLSSMYSTSYREPQSGTTYYNIHRDKITLKNIESTMVVKYEGGLYFTLEGSYAVSVRGKSGGTTVYEGEFLNWEQAVKEIDKLGRKDWEYDIHILKDLGIDKPLASFVMPKKAKKVTIMGGLNVSQKMGILTTAKAITLNSDTEFKQICITAVQAKGGKYYSTAYTMNVGNYELWLNDVLQEYRYDDLNTTYRAGFNIKGRAKGIVTIMSANQKTYAVNSVSGVGSLTLYKEGGGIIEYQMPGGIIGVGSISVGMKKTHIDCGTKEFSVKDCYLATECQIKAKNIMITGTAKLNQIALKAGTMTQGDGKIILGNVVFNDEFCHLEGKVDKAGRSLVEIKGTMSKINGYDRWYDDEPIVTVALCLSNSITRYAQLYEGMKLLKAPKASSSNIKPYYDDLSPSSKGMGEELTKYSLYKNGNDIVYGRMKSEEGNEIPEVRVWIGTNSTGDQVQKNGYIDFMTFEEAVKAIDSMNIQNIQEVNGKNVKVYEKYTIQLLDDVEIGNEKQNGSYKSMSLPSKASDLTIWGNGKEIRFTGNVTVKSNTELANVKLCPVKKVKNEAVPSVANFALGNFELTINQTSCGENLYSNGGTPGVGNVTGSSKSGKLILKGNSVWEANNITGIKAIEFTETSAGACVGAAGNLTVKDITYNSVGKVSAKGNITTDTIHVNTTEAAEIYHNADKTMKVNGTTITNPDKTKITDSVFFENAGQNPKVKLYLSSATGKAIPEGSQIIAGKYLNAEDWTFVVEGNNKKAYLRNNNLYVGSRVN